MRKSALFVLLLTGVPCLAQGQQVPLSTDAPDDVPVTPNEIAEAEVEVQVQLGRLNYSLRADHVQRTPTSIFRGCGKDAELLALRGYKEPEHPTTTKGLALEATWEPEQQQALLHALAWYDPFLGEDSGRCSFSAEIGEEKLQIEIGVVQKGQTPSLVGRCPADGLGVFVTSVTAIADRAVEDRGVEIPDYKYYYTASDVFDGF